MAKPLTKKDAIELEDAIEAFTERLAKDGAEECDRDYFGTLAVNAGALRRKLARRFGFPEVKRAAPR